MVKSLANRIACAVVNEFDNVKVKAGKPIIRSNGTPEWTVLAGLVAIQDDSISVLTLATGVKAMPDQVRKYSDGWIVHDMHAEILCLRMFNWLIVEEIIGFHEHGLDLIEETQSGRFQLKRNIKLALYISEPPCGDASMGILSANQEPWEENKTEVVEKEDQLNDPSDACEKPSIHLEAPHTHLAKSSASEDVLEPYAKRIRILRGRAHFSKVGIVRTKPGRPDSLVSLSKSCSDKLCIKQFMGILNCISSLLVLPVYLDYLVLNKEKHSKEDFERCFRTRLQEPPQHVLSVLLYDEDGYKYHKKEGSEPLPLSLVCCVKRATSQVLQNGVKNGAYVKKKPPKPSGASILCKRKLYLQAKLLIGDYNRYLELKLRNKQREKMKVFSRGQLDNWPSTGTEDFDLQN